MTDISARRLFILAVAALLLGIVIGVIMATTASAAPCDPASAQCCACGPSEAAEPAPLPRIYLPSVMHGVRMSSEYTPAQPIVTPEPDVELPLGDAGVSR